MIQAIGNESEFFALTRFAVVLAITKDSMERYLKTGFRALMDKTIVGGPETHHVHHTFILHSENTRCRALIQLKVKV
jgi:hypothetical protein